MPIRAAALAALLASPALAGDLTPPVATLAPAVPLAAAASPTGPEARGRAGWGGGYVGVQLSYGSADSDDSFGEETSTGGFYGAVTGFRLDTGRIVLGGEVSYDRTDVTFADGTDIDNLLRAGASVGYDFGRYLPYLAGGYANVSIPNDSLDFDDTFHGGFVAAGVAYRVTDRILIGGEVAQHRLDIDGTDGGLTTFAGKVTYRF